jgi:hypothetical protein
MYIAIMASAHHTRQIAAKGPEAKKLEQSSMFHDEFGVHPHLTTPDRKPMLVKPQHSFECPHVMDAHIVTPDKPAPSNLLVVGGVVDFRVKAGGAFKIKHPVLSISVQETGGAQPVTLTKLAHSIKQLEVRFHNGTKDGPVVSDQELFFNTMFLPQEKWSSIAALQNTTGAWGAPTAIAASGSKQYYMPLLGTWFDHVEPHIGSFVDDIIVRITFRPSISAGTGVLAIAPNGLELHFEQDHPTLDDQRRIRSLHQDNGFHHNYFDVLRVNGSQTFTAGTSLNLELKGITGKVPFMIITLRSSDAVTAEGLSTYASIENTAGTSGSLDFLDQGKRSVLGAAPIPATRLRYIDFAKHTTSQMTQTLPVYLMSFAEDATKAWRGASTAFGYMYMTGNELLQITPSANFTTAAYNYDILAYRIRTCELNNGKVELADA